MEVGLERTDGLVVGVGNVMALHRLLAGDLADTGHRGGSRALKRERRAFYYSRPRSAKERAWLPAMMKWSSTLTSTSASASLRLRVSSSSAWLGCATPDGWLWAKITAAALVANACFTISRG